MLYSSLFYEQAIKLFPYIKLIKTFTPAPEKNKENVRMGLLKYEKLEVKNKPTNSKIIKMSSTEKTTQSSEKTPNPTIAV